MQSVRSSLTLVVLSVLIALLSLQLYRFENSLRSAQLQHTRATSRLRAGIDQPPECPRDTPFSLGNVENFDWTYCNIDLRGFWGSLNIPTAKFPDSSSI